MRAVAYQKNPELEARVLEGQRDPVIDPPKIATVSA